MEREACVCDHGYERSDLCAEIIIIIITTFCITHDMSTTTVPAISVCGEKYKMHTNWSQVKKDDS